ncbi:unnamed protein product [Closterium sp. Naga37s-1]|nr:unnamed protein product [Closterium sp. Naga37s-1]
MAQSGRAGSVAAAALRHVLLLQQDVPRAANFFKEGLGLPVLVAEGCAGREGGERSGGLGKEVRWGGGTWGEVMGRGRRAGGKGMIPCRNVTGGGGLRGKEIGTAHTFHGFSPLLSFSVRGEGEFDSTLLRMLRLGAVMDGAVVHMPQGRVAALRAPDGPMLSLVEETEEG